MNKPNPKIKFRPILTGVRNTNETSHPRKIIVPIDIDLAELKEALGNAGFCLFGKGEYVRLKRIPEILRKPSKREVENWYRERQADWIVFNNSDGQD